MNRYSMIYDIKDDDAKPCREIKIRDKTVVTISDEWKVVGVEYPKYYTAETIDELGIRIKRIEKPEADDDRT